MQLAEVQKPVDPAEHVARRDVVFEVEGVEQGRLPGFLTSHHRCDFRWIDGYSVDQLQLAGTTIISSVRAGRRHAFVRILASN
jgi:hypothetical protein